jgi:3-deoxy-7-phosphoheptulonate synthase
MASAFCFAHMVARRSSPDRSARRKDTEFMETKDLASNRRVAGFRALDSPRDLCRRLPLSEGSAEVVIRSRSAVSSILEGTDDRLLVVVGPCSIHDPVAGIEYAERLAELADRLRSDLHVVMRAYFEKPRTTVGWKGLINDPGLDGTFRVNDGLWSARGFLLDVIALGLPVGCEFLDPITPQYLADTVSWGAIGARTTQSQIHRQLASGLSMPVGFKNSTEGDVQSAVDAIAAASGAQVFPGIDDDGRAAIVETRGNPDGHLILRGGSGGPNYDPTSTADALDRLERSGRRRRLVIDASHANSGKDYRKQPLVAANVSGRLADGEDGIVGLMLESFLIPGRQELGAAPLVFGQSITDACIGWDTTAAVLERSAKAVARRRERINGIASVRGRVEDTHDEDHP